MTTMLDKCAVAGDITQGIDRRGVWTAAITVIGGTGGTAVKLVSSDTVNGEYTDYKTLISAADAETDQYKGFVVDLHGAKKFIKVTGAVMATAVFGDCDHDVKNIAIIEGEVPSGADLENNKEVEITENGEIEITPSAGKDGMKKVTATVNVSGGADLEDNKTVSITENGVVEITPSEGKDGMKKVTATVNVSGGGGVDLENNKEATIDVSAYTEPVEITPTVGKDGMKKTTITLDNIPSGGSATAYGWNDNIQGGWWWFSFNIAPESKNAFDDSKYLSINISENKPVDINVVSCTNFFEQGASYTVTKVSDTQFTITYEGQDIFFTRENTKDFTLWG